MLMCALCLYLALNMCIYATYQAALEVLLLIFEVFVLFEYNCVSVKNKEKSS